MSEALVRYGKHEPVSPDASCEACGNRTLHLVTEHCHEHGWVRGVACRQCNHHMALIDRRIMPPTEIIDALITLAARCPECPPVIVADLVTGSLRSPEARRFAIALIPVEPDNSSDHDAARSALRSWRRRSDSVAATRDPLVRNAIDAGLTKEEVHIITGLGRTTIDRIVAKAALEKGSGQ